MQAMYRHSQVKIRVFLILVCLSRRKLEPWIVLMYALLEFVVFNEIITAQVTLLPLIYKLQVPAPFLVESKQILIQNYCNASSSFRLSGESDM